MIVTPVHESIRGVRSRRLLDLAAELAIKYDVGRRYLSNATCQMRPHLFYACFAVSRITTIC